MSILYIITQADGGGAQKYVLSLAKHFKGTIAAGKESDRLFEDAKKAGINTHPLKHLKREIHPIRDILAFFELLKLTNKLKPDIIHLNSSKAGFLGSLLKPFVDAKIIFTAHGFIFNEPFPPLAKWFIVGLEKFASLFRDYIITVSDADRRSALDHKLISQSKISTIHNGIGQVEFLPPEEARKTLNLPLDKKIVGTIANDYKTKGLDILQKALPFFTQNTLVVVIGRVSKKQKDNQENIIFTGYLPNAAKYLKAFDVFVLPSRKEGLPYTLLEAMQAGLPIRATDVGGNREAAGNEALIPPDDPKALSASVNAIIPGSPETKKLSEGGLERAKIFTEEKMLAETEKIYNYLII